KISRRLATACGVIAGKQNRGPIGLARVFEIGKQAAEKPVGIGKVADIAVVIVDGAVGTRERRPMRKGEMQVEQIRQPVPNDTPCRPLEIARGVEVPMSVQLEPGQAETAPWRRLRPIVPKKKR